jgi:hypothetical protein
VIVPTGDRSNAERRPALSRLQAQAAYRDGHRRRLTMNTACIIAAVDSRASWSFWNRASRYRVDWRWKVRW